MFSNIKKILRKVNFGVTFLFVASAAVAQTADNYIPLVGTGGYANFKTSYSPEALNLSSSTSSVVTLRTRHLGLAQSRIKVFIPPGARTFRTSIGTYRVNQPAIAAVRFALPPISVAGDVVPDVNGVDNRQTLPKLQQGQELKFYSPELSGVLMISTAELGTSYQSTTGGYVYINFFAIPGGSFIALDTQVEIEKTCYQSWYNSVNQNNAWTSAGNPRDEDTHSCSGSTGGPVVPALTDISLSRTTWNAVTDAANTTVTVKPQPEGAVLPACTSSSVNLLTAGPVSSTEAQFVINSAALTTTTPVTVTCGGKTAILNLQAVGTVATVGPNDIVLGLDANGKAQLTVTLHHTDAEAAAKTKKVDYWVAALVPTDLPFFGRDEWFFLTAPSVPEAGYQWAQMQNSLDVSSIAFEKNAFINSISKTKKLIIPLGFDAVEFKRINAKIYLVYSQGLGEFREVGTIWDASNYVAP